MNATNPREFWPVIHLRTEQELFRNLRVADAVKADGVFLIDHRGSGAKETAKFYAMAEDYCSTERFKFKIGVNLLGYGPVAALGDKPVGCGDIWSDECGYSVLLRGFDRQTVRRINKAKESNNPRARFWGSFAFKYQTEVPEEQYANLANPPEFLDVLVTSGPGTGEAADVSKIKAIRNQWAGKLAIASGITPGNVVDYLLYVDIVMAATGIGADFYNLDLAKTAEVARLCRECKV